MKRQLPIGIFDSGVGGISVLREIMKILPNENCIYYGDNENAPYGVRPENEIRELSLRCADFLKEKGAKLIVVACNTATSITVQAIRKQSDIPVVSMEPAVKPAIKDRPSEEVAVLATPATLKQDRYLDLLKKLNAQSVVNIEGSGLTELVEHGDFASSEIDDYLTEKFASLQDRPISAIVLGCTHYSFVRDQVYHAAKRVFGRECAIFDGKYGTARQVKRILEQNDGLNHSSVEGTLRFYSSSGTSGVRQLRYFYSLTQSLG